jgi:hypothetical protein
MSSDAVWDKTLADAKKALGTSAKVPDGKMAGVIAKGNDVLKAYTQFSTSREGIKKTLLALQDAASTYKNALAQAEEEISDDDYGLDDKSPDDKKKIGQAQALFKKFFQTREQVADTNIKNLDELDKHLMNLSKYKPPT